MAQHNKTAAGACTQWEEDLVLHYYGELAGSEREAVDDHVRGCEPCRFYLKELESILPLTVKPDEPPQAFWGDYRREKRRKPTRVSDRKSWWQRPAAFFQPWAIPVSATAAVAILALTLTFGKGFLGPQGGSPDDESFFVIFVGGGK